jgi:cytoskeletal protein CcmA (bactofilin family)
MQDQDAVIHALLGAGTRYEGKLFFEGRARIDGEFEGEVFSEGLLVVGEEASIKGAIRVHTLIVRGGQIQGDIHATELVELHAPAEVRGDIRTQALFMEKGVLFDGSCVMGEVLELEDSPVSQRSAEDTSPDGYKDQPNRN